MTNKILVKEQSFTVTANIDERIKTRKNKLLVKQSPKYSLRPKPGGLVINTSTNTVIHKQDQVGGIVIQKFQQTAVYKQIV